ncbi:hypothetical protein Nepgr_013462 [Nepenthes gracilis]|uniref:Uncharacterized protein n=1 Tax=Nepenthes gracilis TaxID=150966 RepID=A0AAD3SJT3_NEPGR|nr:hypothetical protein Nepgr_013462 [Nepenthes gracilis]
MTTEPSFQTLSNVGGTRREHKNSKGMTDQLIQILCYLIIHFSYSSTASSASRKCLDQCNKQFLNANQGAEPTTQLAALSIVDFQPGAEDIIHPEPCLGEGVDDCHQDLIGSSIGSTTALWIPKMLPKTSLFISVRGKESRIDPSKDNGLPVHVGSKVEYHEFSVEPLNSG